MLDIYYLDKSLKKAELKDIERIKPKRLWIDATAITKEESAIIGRTFSLHPVTVEDILKSNVRIKVEEFDKYLFCVFYGAQKNKNLIDLEEIDFVIGKNFVISSHKRKMESTEDLKQDQRRLESFLKKGPDFVFHDILDFELDNFFPIIEGIDEEIEKISEQLIGKKPRKESLARILKIRRNLTIKKRVIFSQREKVSFLAKRDYKFISDAAMPYFRDAYDSIIRVSDSLENSREAIANSFDIYMSAVSLNTNEVMKVLSIIATMALPLTVISSIYGTNFDVLPGKGIAYGFWLMILAMIIFSGSMVIYFRRKGWF